MKKGFTMIELIFVIVILGILASVAIPRLAGTRDDAEISAAIGNLRTLLSDANAYYVVKGSFGSAKWQDFTNVPLDSATAQAVATGGTAAATAYLKAGGENCIGLYLVEKTDTAPAHIVFTQPAGTGTTCTKVKGAASVKTYLESKIPDDTNPGKMPIGSNTKIY